MSITGDESYIICIPDSLRAIGSHRMMRVSSAGVSRRSSRLRSLGQDYPPTTRVAEKHLAIVAASDRGTSPANSHEPQVLLILDPLLGPYDLRLRLQLDVIDLDDLLQLELQLLDESIDQRRSEASLESGAKAIMGDILETDGSSRRIPVIR